MLSDRVRYFTQIFSMLICTNSRLEKEVIIRNIKQEYKDDFYYIIEVLAGKHMFGYKYTASESSYGLWNDIANWTVRQLLEYLQEPYKTGNLTDGNIARHIISTSAYGYFIEPIVNRTLKLGIGSSLLEKPSTSPMLAKKLEDGLPSSRTYFITEKLDGNRCIMYYENDKWNYISRNGKPMYVEFDTNGLDTSFIYDGEILSEDQVMMSNYIAKAALDKVAPINFKTSFNVTSGLINTHTTSKNLIYNIFDIMNVSAKYIERRELLDTIADELKRAENKNIRILPVLKTYTTQDELFSDVPCLLDKVTTIGGEGLMINLGDAFYCNKRTNNILKYKKLYTMDMRVVDFEDGNGKYEFMVGALIAEVITDDGKQIKCKIGSGLSDTQREEWYLHPELIIGKIVEVAYFDISQEKDLKGTNMYSLRFPRLKSIRDKITTSEY